jgi:hypothetical protein
LKTPVVVALLVLSACSDSRVLQRHHRHARPQPTAEAVVPTEKPRAETHDELVARIHRESMQRRKDYCDSHPNLSVRIGCE